MRTKLLSTWTKYERPYEKELQDIRLKDGIEYLECWPNAGQWHCLKENVHNIPDEEVVCTRLSKSNFL